MRRILDRVRNPRASCAPRRSSAAAAPRVLIVMDERPQMEVLAKYLRRNRSDRERDCRSGVGARRLVGVRRGDRLRPRQAAGADRAEDHRLHEGRRPLRRPPSHDQQRQVEEPLLLRLHGREHDRHRAVARAVAARRPLRLARPRGHHRRQSQPVALHHDAGHHLARQRAVCRGREESRRSAVVHHRPRGGVHERQLRRRSREDGAARPVAISTIATARCTCRKPKAGSSRRAKGGSSTSSLATSRPSSSTRSCRG